MSTSAYYAWAAKTARGPSSAERDQVALVGEIRRIHARSRGTYGSPRVTVRLRRRGWRVNHKRVERLMAVHGIVGHRPRRRRGLTKPDPADPPAPDLLGRRFDPDQPDVAWCGDITCIPTDEGWLYLASVIDLASHHLLGWSTGAHHDAGLVTRALDAAVAARGHARMPDTISTRPRQRIHLDGLHRCLRPAGAAPVMGRTGSCLDNAFAGSWFAMLKVELVDRQHYRTRAEARTSIFGWIAWYNRDRLHSATGYRLPIEYEQHLISPLPSTMAA